MHHRYDRRLSCHCSNTDVVRQIQVLNAWWRVLIIVPGHWSGQITFWADFTQRSGFRRGRGSSVRDRPGLRAVRSLDSVETLRLWCPELPLLLIPLCSGVKQIPRATFHPHPQIQTEKNPVSDCFAEVWCVDRWFIDNFFIFLVWLSRGVWHGTVPSGSEKVGFSAHCGWASQSSSSSDSE